MKPTAATTLNYPQALTPEKVNPAITPPEKVLGFPVGQRTATPEQINELVKLWAKESDRISYQQYATSYERPATAFISYFDTEKPGCVTGYSTKSANAGKTSRQIVQRHRKSH